MFSYAERYWAEKIIRLALAEDVGRGDITTAAVVDPEAKARGYIVFRERGVLAGLPVVAMVYERIDPRVQVLPSRRDGDLLLPGESAALLEGPAWALLTGERVALNFLQRLSGIATATAELVELVRPYPCQVADTRKTAPGMRVLEKYAVRVGGGRNHRLGLDDAILIKDNHVIAAGGIAKAVAAARAKAPLTARIEVEVESREQVEEALAAGVDIIMLDNMDVHQMARMVDLIDGRALVEASGGITRDSIAAVAATGVDFISVGAITHSSRALDVALDLAISEGAAK
ncbi:MAG: carboxylating nicotinate-nucleotide diphosphorylase [Firmicutes bacterium]|jgi:nicotinate-nucleotide pyrophosphorylase (carboxylating)|nr:carboxylating nicotinate-nucleotide diphosphorylase [Bacillota bacterium]